MTVTEYVLNSLAWSALGLAAGATLAQIGWDLRELLLTKKKGDRRDHA